MKMTYLSVLVAGSMLAAVNMAQAQTAIGEMGVSADVNRICTLGAESMDFGALSVEAVNSGSAVVTLTCNGVSTVTTILVGMGSNALPPTTQRNLVSGINLVPYTLHVLEAGGADIATDGAVTLVQQGTTNIYSTTLYGKIQPSTAYPMGSYADTVVLTAVYAP